MNTTPRRQLRRAAAPVALSLLLVGALTACSASNTQTPTANTKATTPTAGATPTDSQGIIQHLQFREVTAETPSATGDCKTPTLAMLKETTKACSLDGKTVYTLGPAFLSGAVASDFSEIDGNVPTRQITLNIGPLDQNHPAAESKARIKALSDATTELATHPSPTNKLAIYKDGVVYLAVPVMAPILGGSLVIAADTDAEFKSLSDALGL